MITPKINTGKNEKSAPKDFSDSLNDDSIQFLRKYTQKEPGSGNSLFWVDCNESANLKRFDSDASGIGILNVLNTIEDLNTFLGDINKKLHEGQFLITRVEALESRKRYIIENSGRLKNGFDFIRRKISNRASLISSGENRLEPYFQAISLPEVLARLVYTGFSIVDYKTVGTLTYIIAKKNGELITDKKAPSGVIIKLNRVGKNRKLFKVFKFRTMYPYSEYLQEYIYNEHGTSDGDKITDDFRVTPAGKILRKYWIDELPMLINFLKGDLKVFGVRPLSEHKFKTYPEELQKMRIKTKPGLISPYYADLPESPEAFFESEKRYLQKYSRRPLKTDMIYFIKSVYNIVVKGVRSR